LSTFTAFGAGKMQRAFESCVVLLHQACELGLAHSGQGLDVLGLALERPARVTGNASAVEKAPANKLKVLNARNWDCLRHEWPRSRSERGVSSGSVYPLRNAAARPTEGDLCS